MCERGALASLRSLTLAAIAQGYGAPRPACGERATRHLGKPELGPVRGRFHKLRLAEAPPHPDLLHSPSKTGVNALMARGEKETAVRRAHRSHKASLQSHKTSLLVLLCWLGLATASPARAEDGFVDLPNAKLWVTDSGGTGEPIVLLHANTGTSENWQKQTPALVAAGYRVIAFDRPGWGKSAVREGQKPISVAEDLNDLADHLKLGTFHLLGVAGGGYIALDYAAWRPERLKSLVIGASGLGLVGDAEAETFRKQAAIPGFSQLPPEVREMSPSYRGMDPAGVARWKEIEAHAAQPGAVVPPLRTPNTDAKIASITTPILVIAGDVDLTTPSAAIRLWAKHLKSYEWALIPEAGHSVAWEQPEAFNEAVVAFLRKY
jgi:pimeloyl-ACP methyl ester carboxylesterase